MKLTIMAGDDRFIEVEVESEAMVEGVKAIVEAETGIAVARQSIVFQGAVLPDTSRLDASGVKDSDMLLMVEQGGTPGQAAGSATGAPQRGRGAGRMDDVAMRQNEDGSAVDPQAFRLGVLANRDLFLRLSQVNPSLAAAIESNNIEGMQKGLRAQRDHAREMERKAKEDEELMYADPMDPAVQARIAEKIQQENIDLNLEVALEHNPEQFVAVHMLYVDMEINNHPIKAFIDSGAQQTIMSVGCAERCGLMRLLDKRFHGMAVGVGTQKIVGIIHGAQLKIGKNFYSCRISVLESLHMDFLFGLDMLRRHQCCIDLQANVLRVGGEINAPFLAEQDCPKRDDPILENMEASEASAAAAGGGAGGDGKGGGAVSTAGAGPSTTQSSGSLPPSSAPSIPGSARAPPPSVAATMESKVAKLVELGFTKEQAAEALMLTNGNEEQAAGLLFGGL